MDETTAVYVGARMMRRLEDESDRAETPIEIIVAEALDAYLVACEGGRTDWHSHTVEACGWDGIDWTCSQ